MSDKEKNALMLAAVGAGALPVSYINTVLAPSFLTMLSEQAARKNNEV